MNPIQALQILNNATAGLTLSRQDHLTILQAIKVLEAAVQPKPSPEKAKQEVPAPEVAQEVPPPAGKKK